jgi:ribosomal protein S18 acetylase RimI-like enzyme
VDSDEHPTESNRSHGQPNTGAIEIRQMTVDDISPIFHLGNTLFTAREVPSLHRTWDEYEVVSLFQTDGDYCFTAVNEAAQVIGFALGTVIEKHHSWTYGYLIWLGIRPDYHHSGIAQRLFQRFRQAMIENGARIIMVDTDAENQASLNFFRKMGFNNIRRHVYLTMNVDGERRRHEDRRRKDRETRPLEAACPKTPENGLVTGA